MSFLYPYLLLLLLIPLALLILLIVMEGRRKKNWQRLVSAEHEQDLVTRLPAYRRTLPAFLTILALAGTIVGLARPFNGYIEQSTAGSSRNLLIALDISRSMETRDISPSRLEEARAACYELIDALPSDKLGLIIFSGESELVVPLTYDHDALKQTLASVKRDWSPYGGTNYGRVLEKAMEDFARSAPTGTNAVVIFSDGEDTVGSTIEVAEKAREKKLLVITVGVGTEIGDAIPDPDGENGLYQDAEGKNVISKLDTKSLIQFAKATGGDYFAMGSGADLTAFAQSAAAKLERHENESSLTKSPRDLFRYFIFMSAVWLLLAIVLGTEWSLPRWQKRSLTGGFILALILGGFSTEARADDALYKELKTVLNKYEYEKAKDLIEEAVAHDISLMEDASLSFALATAQLGLGEVEEARSSFSRAMLSSDPTLQAAAKHQLGKLNVESSFQQLRDLYKPVVEGEPKNVSSEDLEKIQTQLQQDIEHYRDALGIIAGHEPSQRDLAKTESFLKQLQEEIDRLKEEEKKQQDQQDQQEQQQNQNNQQQNQQGEQGEQNKQQEQNNQEGQQGEQEESKNNQQGQQNNQQAQQEQKQNQDTPQEGQKDQDEQQNQAEDQSQESQQEQQGQQEKQEQPMELSQDEKDAQRARSILEMHLDEDGGSPIPRPYGDTRPPSKDY